MANRRMFSNQIIDSRRFLQMPVDARLLYFDLGMKADDNGKVDAYHVLKLTDSSADNIRILIENHFVEQIGDWNDLKIVHWVENNGTKAKNKRNGGKRFSGNRGYVLDRDGNKCTICGSKESLVVHHIDGYFENIPQNNHVNKLITLCSKCHYAAHHNNFCIPKNILEKIGYFDGE